LDENELDENEKKGSEAFFTEPPPGRSRKRLLTPFSLSAWLTQVSAVAACDAIRQATDVTPAIKWPNDLRIGGRKVGGILIETRTVDSPAGSKNGHIPFGGHPEILESHRRDTGATRSSGCADIPIFHRAWVVGIGINCLQQAGHFPPELRESATSLELATDHPVDRVAVARELLKALDRRLAPELWGQTEQVHRDWLAYAEPIGQKVRLRREGQDYAGWTVEVDPVGGLIVKLETGQQEWFDPMRTMLL
jgi:BirA family biotin operon repressor/biotin-[acetyl-CoA-carboxylase] ligase